MGEVGVISKERELLQRIFNYAENLPAKIHYDIMQLLAQPEQEPEAWIKTNGKEPTEFEAYEYIWTHWKSGRVSLDEAYGCWTWEDITHWMPANIIEPNKPRVDDAG